MEEKVLQIDLNEVLRSRAPNLHRFMPRFVVSWLEKLIRQKEMNSLLMANRDLQGSEFCHGVLDYLNIKLEIDGLENLPDDANIDSWRVIFCSNHPLGGLDGMALIDFLCSRSPSGELRFIVNDLLMNIPPLRGVFLPVNTIKKVQSKETARKLDEVFEGDLPVAIFPAGLCSRLIKGKIQDLKWNKMFVNKAISYKRDIIPVHFSGRNSRFFYNFAKIRKALHVPFNLEMVLLPGEVFKNRNSVFRITIGKRISYKELEGGKKAESTGAKLREYVYRLKND